MNQQEQSTKRAAIFQDTINGTNDPTPWPVTMWASEGDMRVMFLLWDATSGNKSLKIVEIPIKTAPRALNNPDFPEK